MTGLYHGWDGEEDTHADFVHGGVPPSDFEDLVPYRKKRGKARKKKEKRGCPENDFGPHIYVWTPQVLLYSWWPEKGADPFYDKYGFHRREVKTCCGCEKTNGYRYTAEFQKRINKLGWYKANYDRD